MKTIKSLGLALAAILIGFTSCTKDEDFSSSNHAGEFCINATIPGYTFSSSTRVNISEDLQTFTWETGDLLGVYYSDSNVDAFSGFKIKQGGGSTGSFYNGSAFDLKKSTTYYAFYPFNSEATISAVPVDYTGQVQTGNGSTAHLSDYNYMHGKLTTDASGQGSVNFINLGAVMQIKLTAPTAGIYKTLTISSDNTPFITKGKASMVNGAVTAVENSQDMTLSFGEGLTLASGDILTANLLVAPVNMNESNLTFLLKDEADNAYQLTLSGKNMIKGRAYLYDGQTSQWEEIKNIPYITFTSDVKQAFQISKTISTLECSVNGGEWEILGNSTISFGGTKGDLRLRGKSSVGTNGAKISFVNETKVSCRGDIRTLIDHENYDTVDTSEALFNELFYNCSQLTSSPELPATNLVDSCYSSMFNGCTSLTQAPELPATTLVNSCYYNMFNGCTSLTQAPELPATNLAQSCYNSMFQGCTSLTQAPELPAITLANSCYSNMFNGCTSLTQVPELPATNLAQSCYNSMFQGCTSLTQAPELPATNLARGCYNSMFQGCTSLTQAPELPATRLIEWCYGNMFNGCTSLMQAPELPANFLVEYCYYDMFYGCSNLNYIKMMANNLNDEWLHRYFNGWVFGVSSVGTFIKNKDATWNEHYIIPEGWTVETASE